MYNLLHYFNIPIHVQEVWSRWLPLTVQNLPFALLPVSATVVALLYTLLLCLPPRTALLASSFVHVILLQSGVSTHMIKAMLMPLSCIQVCVFTAPLFSAFCALATYAFVKEIRGQGAGLVASAFMALVPSYISRSVAGSFDNEGVAIFALVFVFFLYIKVCASFPHLSAGLILNSPPFY